MRSLTLEQGLNDSSLARTLRSEPLRQLGEPNERRVADQLRDVVCDSGHSFFTFDCRVALRVVGRRRLLLGLRFCLTVCPLSAGVLVGRHHVPQGDTIQHFLDGVADLLPDAASGAARSLAALVALRHAGARV